MCCSYNSVVLFIPNISCVDLYHSILIHVGWQVLTHLGEAGNWSLYDVQMEANRDICEQLLQLLQFLSSSKDTEITSNGKNCLLAFIC